MALPITPIHLANPTAAIQPIQVMPPATAANGGTIFQETFNKAVNTVEDLQTQAANAVESFLSGQNEDVHTPIIATQKADLSFEMFMQVRNKVIAAYQEIMKLQV